MRTDSLAVFLSVNLEELPPKIGISRGMFYAYRAGKSPISAKAWHKLEQAERAAGLAPPLVEQVAEAKAHAPAAVTHIVASATGDEALSLLPLDARMKLVAELEKLIDQFIQTSTDLADVASLYLANPANKHTATDLETLASEVQNRAEFLKRIRLIQ